MTFVLNSKKTNNNAIEQVYCQLGIEKNTHNIIDSRKFSETESIIANGYNEMSAEAAKRIFGIRKISEVERKEKLVVEIGAELAKQTDLKKIVLPNKFCKVAVLKNARVIAWAGIGKKIPVVVEKRHKNFSAFFIAIDIFSLAEEFYSFSENSWINSRDKTGRAIGAKSEIGKKKLNNFPVVDSGARLFEGVLALCAKRDKTCFVKKLPWPNGKDFCFFVSHDVDSLSMPPHLIFAKSIENLASGKISTAIKQAGLSFAYSASAVKGLLQNRLDFSAPKLFSGLRNTDPWFNIKKINELEKENGIKSSFFFLNNCSFENSSYRFNEESAKESFKSIMDSGSEIALHARTHGFDDTRVLAEDKKELEQESKTRVQGVRNHKLLFNSETGKAEQSAGLSYSSNCFFNDLTGFACGTGLPFTLHGKNFLEIPASVMDVSLAIEQEQDGEEFSAEKAFERIKKICNQCIEHNSVFGLSWHPYSFETGTKQRIFEKRFTHGITNGKRIFRQTIEYVLSKNAWNETGEKIASWWKKRSKVRISFSKDKKSIVVSGTAGLGGLSICFYGCKPKKCAGVKISKKESKQCAVIEEDCIKKIIPLA